ncbi:DUF7822 domain-containing protein [Rheinheimera faecalis]
MANRSYLYSSNLEPKHSDALVLTGLSEWNYEIPLLYKILFSGNTSFPCKSLIFDIHEQLAVSITYQNAINNLLSFTNEISSFYSSSVLNTALQFLMLESNRGEFLILEPYEIYLLHEAEPEVQQQALLEQLKSLQIKVIAQDLINKCATQDVKAFTSFFKKTKAGSSELEDLLKASGFNEWSNSLCYAPYAPSKKVISFNYDTADKVTFELSDLNSYSWFKIIEIDKKTKKVFLKEHRNRREFIAELVNENRDTNDLLNFRFNIYPKSKQDFMHIFSLRNSRGDDGKWSLSCATLENKNGDITLHSVSEVVEYHFLQETINY